LRGARRRHARRGHARPQEARARRLLGGRMTSPLRVVVGTAGHVDHGKTALVRALTGIDTDRLPEAKRRGITLEAGYAHLELPGDAAVVEVSGRTGEGLPELVRAVGDAVRARQETPRPEQAPLFLPLDRSFGVEGFGTVITGTLFSGALAAGDEVDLAGAGAKARGIRVRGVQVHGAAVEKARAGQRTAANLAGIEVHDAPRGAAL